MTSSDSVLAGAWIALLTPGQQKWCKSAVLGKWKKIGRRGDKRLNGSSKSQWQRQVLRMQNKGPFMDSAVS